jgi:hypothetical protein
VDSRFQPQHFKAEHVAQCLRALLRQLRGHVIGLWERGPRHQGAAITAVQRAYPRLHLEEFPADAPELNPTEQLWNACQGPIATSLWHEFRDLRRRLLAKSRRGRRSQANRRSCILASKLPSPP